MKSNKATISIRSGLNSDEQYGCIVSPISLSTNYNFYGFKQPRLYDYSRRRNPTRDRTQQALADLEQGQYAVITSSGMSAIYLVCASLLKPNDLLLAPHDCYGGTYRLFAALHDKGMCKVQFVDQNDLKFVSECIRKNNPKLIFIETPSNPLLRIVDIRSICNFKGKDIICVVDNTFMTPVFQNPLNLGADLVLHSCSKYLNGHSDLIAGVVVCKDIYFFDKLSWWANTLGITGSAFDSYQLLRGIRTLVTRVCQQQRNTVEIINFCLDQSMIKRLYYPGLPKHPNHKIACQQQSGFGSIFSFELKGFESTTLSQFLKSLRLFILAESFGGVESLIAHPKTMTHAAMSESARISAGINDMLLRVSVGLEDSNDLIDDLNQGFKSIS